MKPLTWRKFKVLLAGLPRDAETVIAVHGEPPYRPSTGEVLKMVHINDDRMRWWAEQAGRAEAAKKPKPEKPKLVELPGLGGSTPVRKGRTKEQVDELLYGGKHRWVDKAAVERREGGET